MRAKPGHMEEATRKRNMSLSYDWDRVVASERNLTNRKISRCITDSDTFGPFHPGYINIERSRHEFITGSSYVGQWNSLGMAGSGLFTLPHGVEYEGSLHDGMFHGEGTLTYPMGQKMDGEWVKGKMVTFKYRFADSLEYDIPWKYCQMPDRRFFTSIQEGLRPAGRSLATNDHVARTIPEGCYDTGDGFYNPATKCVTSAINPEKILRVPTTTEEKWIMKNCRKAWDEPAGYRPDLYEHWVTGRSTDSVFLDSEKDSSSSSSNNNSGCQSTSTPVDEERISMIVSADKNVFAQSSEGNWWNNIPTATS